MNNLVVSILVLILSMCGIVVSEEPMTADDRLEYIYDECAILKDSINCLQLKTLTYLERSLEVDNIQVWDGVKLIRNKREESTYSGRQSTGPRRTLSEEEIETLLPSDAQARHLRLRSLLFDRISKFLRSRALKFDIAKYLPGFSIKLAPAENPRTFLELDLEVDDKMKAQETGRKIKKMMMPLMMGLIMKLGTLIPMALGTLALMAGKALMVGLISLLLSAVIGIKKLMSKDSQPSYEIVRPHHHGHSGGPHRRSFQNLEGENNDPHSLAYKAHQAKGTTSTKKP